MDDGTGFQPSGIVWPANQGRGPGLVWVGPLARKANAGILRSGQNDGVFAVTYKMLTARAARRTTVAKEMRAWIIMRTLAQRERTGQSVGEKAVLVLKATKR